MNEKQKPGPRHAARASSCKAGTRVAPRAVVSSRDLLAGRREIVILHGTVEYRLRVTSQGKLILTK